MRFLEPRGNWRNIPLWPYCHNDSYALLAARLSTSSVCLTLSTDLGDTSIPFMRCRSTIYLQGHGSHANNWGRRSLCLVLEALSVPSQVLLTGFMLCIEAELLFVSLSKLFITCYSLLIGCSFMLQKASTWQRIPRWQMLVTEKLRHHSKGRLHYTNSIQ